MFSELAANTPQPTDADPKTPDSDSYTPSTSFETSSPTLIGPVRPPKYAVEPIQICAHDSSRYAPVDLNVIDFTYLTNQSPTRLAISLRKTGFRYLGWSTQNGISSHERYGSISDNIPCRKQRRR